MRAQGHCRTAEPWGMVRQLRVVGWEEHSGADAAATQLRCVVVARAILSGQGKRATFTFKGRRSPGSCGCRGERTSATGFS